MGQIVENPVIPNRVNEGTPKLFYLADGAAIFGCIGNPEGVITANKRSLALSDDGNIYFKTTDNAATGWTVSGGGGGSIGGSIAATQIAVGSAANTISGSANLTFVSGSVGIAGTTNPGVVITGTAATESGITINQAITGAAADAFVSLASSSDTALFRLTSDSFTPANLVKARQIDFFGSAGIVEFLLRLATASSRFVFGVNNGEAASIQSTTTENLVLGSPSTGAVPRDGQIKFYNETNANYLQFRAGDFPASRIYDLPITSPTGTQALVGTLSGSTITLGWASASGGALTATQVGFGDGSNVLSGSADFLYIDSTGVLTLTKALNSSVRFVVTNGIGAAAQARIAVASNVSGAALAAYSSTYTTSGLIVANSVVLDMDGSTAMILAQSGGTFKIALGSTVEHLRLTSTVFTLFGPNSGSVTGISVTSAAAGSGVTIAALSSGVNESLILSSKGSGTTTLTTATTNFSSPSFYILLNNLPVFENGGGAVLRFSQGYSTVRLDATTPHLQFGGAADLGITKAATTIARITNGSTGSGGLLIGTSTDTGVIGALVISASILRGATANFTFGAQDAAAPVAQNLSVQNVVTGTSNTNGQNFTIFGSKSTGNQPGGAIVFAVTPAGASGTSVNSTANGWVIDGTGRLYSQTSHNNAAGMAGTSNQYFGSGTYTPTVTAVSNCTAAAAGTCSYMRVGNVVTVSGQISIDPTSASTLTQVGISLPLASTLASTNNCNGTAAAPTVASYSAAIAGDVANARAELQFTAGADVANRAWSFHFTYEVL